MGTLAVCRGVAGSVLIWGDARACDWRIYKIPIYWRIYRSGLGICVKEGFQVGSGMVELRYGFLVATKIGDTLIQVRIMSPARCWQLGPWRLQDFEPAPGGLYRSCGR